MLVEYLFTRESKKKKDRKRWKSLSYYHIRLIDGTIRFLQLFFCVIQVYSDTILKKLTVCILVTRGLLRFYHNSLDLYDHF